MSNEPETHLFIIWQRAQEKQSQILADIESQFQIQALYRVHWSTQYFSSNLTRFYGKKLANGSFKEKECGRGPFLLIVVKDLNPLHELRLTSRGSELVNINMFDAKELYRSWTGGGHKVHATNTIAETNHDLVLLLGHTIDDFKSPMAQDITELPRELTGANGWQDLAQLFHVLNFTTNYIALRNFEGFPQQYFLEQHQDIDLLTDELESLVFISNAKKVFRQKYRVHYHVKINQSQVPFDFRFVGDNYYDANWENELLLSRVFQDGGFYSPDPINYFYSLLYHALIHKQHFTDEYQARLIIMAETLQIATAENLSTALSTSQRAFTLLTEYMQQQGYIISEPKDLSVVLNTDYYSFKNYSLKRKFKFYCSKKTIQRAMTKLQS